jgi:ubiquinone/menaquinone biosynthesis C-methylase UbiE
MSLSDAWEQEAERWIRWARMPGLDSYWRFHRDQFLELVPPPGRLTLDIGCGEGRLSRDLTRLGHRVIGIDASATLIAAARAADPDGDYRLASASALPLEDKSCDLVVAFMALQDMDDLMSSVAEMARVLDGGGVACLAVVHPLNSAGRFADESATSPFVIAGTYLGKFDYAEDLTRNGLRRVFHSRHRPLEAYSRALERSGFVIEAIREHPVPEAAVKFERSRRWQRIPLFLHMRARKPGQLTTVDLDCRLPTWTVDCRPTTDDYLDFKCSM